MTQPQDPYCSRHLSRDYIYGMRDLGWMLVGLGALLMLAGGVFLLVARLGLPLGRLPGDIAFRGKNFSFYAPIATCLLLSLFLSLILWLFGHFRR